MQIQAAANLMSPIYLTENKVNIVKVGGYGRLSVEDRNAGESESIQTQKSIITDYCKEHGYVLVELFLDDGVSGTTFERPAFKRMIEAIERGEINTVVCKDLSRFARNYFEAGVYLHKYFIEKGVRFIAIGDHVDSANGNYGLNVPILNIMNYEYAQNISEKTRDAKKARAKHGMFLGSKAPYGYIRDPQDRHHLLVDEEAAGIVRRIFAMAEDGAGYNKIAKTMQNEGVLNPISYFIEKNPDYFTNGYYLHESKWHVTSVKAILTNPVYLGHTVNGRRTSKTMKGKSEKAPEENWIVAENTHEALTTPAQWENVQKQIAVRSRACKDGKPQMFAGLLYCADCGSALSYSRAPRKTVPDSGQYKCWYYMRYGKEYCSTHYISEKQIKAVVLDAIRRNAQYARLYHNRYEKMLTAALAESAQGKLKDRKKEAEKARKRIETLDGIIRKLLEQNAAGAITDERFATLAAGYEQEQRELKAVLDDYEAAAREVDEAVIKAEQFTSLIEKYTDLQELDAHVLHTLIERIEVSQRETQPDGSKTQKVTIYFKYVGYVHIPM